MINNNHSILNRLAARRIFDIVKYIFAILFFITIQNFAHAQNNSRFYSVDVPREMVQGQSYQATVGFHNTGTTTWTAAGGYVVASIDGYLWGTPNVPLPPSVIIPPGSNYFFTIPIKPVSAGTYTFSWQMRQGDNDWFGDLSQASAATAPVVVVSKKPLTTSNAAFVSQSIPTNMVAGQTYAVSVTMENTGPTTWGTSTYRIGLSNQATDTTWRSPRIYPGTSVAPGQKYTFNFDLTAPSAPGTYNLQWQMGQIGVAWFGEVTPNLDITVSAQLPNSASFVSQTVPTSMNTGQTYTASVTMKNLGTTTWTDASFYRLGSQNPQDNTSWTGTTRVVLNSPVAPGQQYTFSFPVTAPTTPGTYNFQWQMVQDGVQWFGGMSANLAIAVSKPVPNNATFVSQDIPSNMIAGQMYNASVTMLNTGSATWTEGTLYRLGSQNPQDTTRWGGITRAMLSSPVAPGQQYTFTFPITAPSTAGTYNFQWQMVQDGVQWFGEKSSNLAIAVSNAVPNNAAFVSQSIPTNMVGGQTYSATVTMRNTGSATWTEGVMYRLGSQNPDNNSTWGVGRAYLTTAVAPGQQYTFTFPITAPSAPGTYNFQWRMLQENVVWFGESSTNIPISVSATAATNNAAFVSQSLPVTTMTAGQTYTVAVTMRNTGTTTWTAADAYKLGAQNPQDPLNTRWNSTGRVPVGASVAPGQQYTFTFPVTAPATPGTYNFQWKMVREYVEWFGALTPNIAIPVVAAGTNIETITYFHNDVSGSPMLATDASGNLLWNESYLPYGERLNDNDDSNNPLWFTGKPYDNDSGLSYMGARYYNPVLGRFMGVDPKGFDTDNVHSFNRYAYANNNPYKYVDPDGRSPLLLIPLAWMGGGALVGGATNAVGQWIMHGTIKWTGLGGVMDAASEGATLGPVLGAVSARAGIATETSTAAKSGVVVTDSAIQAALKGSDLKTVQNSISKPVVENYVRRLEAGEVAPAIKVDGKVIVDGNHRYVAGRLVGQEPAQTSGALSPSQAGKVRPVQNLEIKSNDWGNR